MKIASALVISPVVAATLLLGGCGSSDEASDEPTEVTTVAPSDTATPTAQAPTPEPADETADVEIVIKDGTVTPQGKRVEVEAGQKITLNITSDVAEEIHVHSDPEHTYDVAAGSPVSESFTIDTPGQVAVEAHGLGVTIVQLVVR